MPVFDPPGKIILTHNPDGLRFELSFGPYGGRLEIWISPGARSDRHYWKRNFSNRDDHTRLFDAISLPGLIEGEFAGTEYDPLHVVVRFRTQTLHLVPSLEGPAGVLWFEAAQSVDFKSDKQDSLATRSARQFAVRHPDRGLSFDFVANCDGKSVFRHQVLEDRGRSLYARAVMAPQSLLCIAGEESGAIDVERLCETLVSQGQTGLLERQDKIAAELLGPGQIVLRDDPVLSRVVDVNRRVLLTMQDWQGAIRAALNRIYYLIWVRDGAIIEVFQAVSGAPDGLRRWREFLLANPTEPANTEGRTYGMLVNPITKLEEDGVFHAVWTVFSDWTQSGVLPALAELDVLCDACDWLERQCWDEDLGLLGRLYRCEEPFRSSPDWGFDNAVGNPNDSGTVKWQGREVRRAFDFYINELGHNAWRMLSMMLREAGDERRAETYASKASRLAAGLAKWPGNERPSYGLLDTADAAPEWTGPAGLDPTDYEWAISVPPLPALPAARAARLAVLISEMETKFDGRFLAAFFSILAATDTLDSPEETLVNLMRRVAALCEREGQFLAMPFSMVEMTGVPDGDPYHDVRPQAFSVGPFLASLAGLGVRRLPFGLALRPSRVLAELPHYEFRGARLKIDFGGEGEGWAFDGRPVEGTWQIPSPWIVPGETHRISVGSRVPANAGWVASTVELESASVGHYTFLARGANAIRIRHDRPVTFRCCSQAGADVVLRITPIPDGSWIEFDGYGRFTLEQI